MARFFKIHLDGFLMIEAEHEAEALQIANEWNHFIMFNHWTAADHGNGDGPLHWRPQNPPVIVERVPNGFIACNAWLKNGEGYPEDVTERFIDLNLNDPGFNGPG